MDYIIDHFPERQLFATLIDGYAAYLEYHWAEGTLDILHTKVSPYLEGRGVGAALVKTAYEFALEQGLKPKATCTFAAKWLEKHSDNL